MHFIIILTWKRGGVFGAICSSFVLPLSLCKRYALLTTPLLLLRVPLYCTPTFYSNSKDIWASPWAQLSHLFPKHWGTEVVFEALAAPAQDPGAYPLKPTLGCVFSKDLLPSQQLCDDTSTYNGKNWCLGVEFAPWAWPDKKLCPAVHSTGVSQLTQGEL